MTQRLLGRILAGGLFLYFLWLTVAGAAYWWHSREAERGTVSRFRPASAHLTSSQRILIFTPHPDDETLGCGGLIQQAVKAGAAVRVVFLTNGDAFPHAVEREYRTLRPNPSDFIRFGETRMQEARTACRFLGLADSSIVFLGFPDGGLSVLWRDGWTPDAALTAKFTKVNHVPYAGTAAPRAPYCGSALLAAIEREISAFRPTDVFTTHPADDHRDHAAASAFVTAALGQLRDAEALPPGGCRLHYYLIHRGNWPQPQGLHPKTRLAPPSEMFGLDTHWSGTALTRDQVLRKKRAIECYRSQMNVMARFMYSFVRTSEFYGTIHPASIESPAHDALTAGVAPTIALIPDAVADNLVRSWRPEGDIAALRITERDGNLDLRVLTSKGPDRSATGRVYVRWFARGAGDMTGALTVQQTRSGEKAGSRCTLEREADGFATVLPASEVRHADAVFVDAEVRASGVMTDRLGPHQVLIKGRPR